MEIPRFASRENFLSGLSNAIREQKQRRIIRRALQQFPDVFAPMEGDFQEQAECMINAISEAMFDESVPVNVRGRLSSLSALLTERFCLDQKSS